MMQAADEAPAAVLQPIVLTYIAEQQMLAGRIADAAATLDRATGELVTQLNRFYDAEMKRFSERLAFWRKRCVELGGTPAL